MLPLVRVWQAAADRIRHEPTYLKPCCNSIASGQTGHAPRQKPARPGGR
ncbi:hypothetical protein NY78_1758 [Desulfovibrio sp. TomC]|nr:hypothetical protein NY78_1758 [Desulfovibrio sp. TomC]